MLINAALIENDSNETAHSDEDPEGAGDKYSIFFGF